MFRTIIQIDASQAAAVGASVSQPRRFSRLSGGPWFEATRRYHTKDTPTVAGSDPQILWRTGPARRAQAAPCATVRSKAAASSALV